jgi:hypothetical protein
VRGGVDGGAAALKMQTVMALTAQLMGRQAAVVVQVGAVAGLYVVWRFLASKVTHGCFLLVPEGDCAILHNICDCRCCMGAAL